MKKEAGDVQKGILAILVGTILFLGLMIPLSLNKESLQFAPKKFSNEPIPRPPISDSQDSDLGQGGTPSYGENCKWKETKTSQYTNSRENHYVTVSIVNMHNGKFITLGDTSININQPDLCRSVCDYYGDKNARSICLDQIQYTRECKKPCALWIIPMSQIINENLYFREISRNEGSLTCECGYTYTATCEKKFLCEIWPVYR